MAQIRHDRDRSGNRGRGDAALQGALTAAEGHEVQIRPTDPIAARLPHDVLRAVPQKKLGRVVPKTLSGMGFKNGNILESLMGIGNFIGNLPDEMNKSKFYGVELDSISGRIGKFLYPESDIQIKGLDRRAHV